MILITTSRRPSSRTRSLCKDLTRVIPESKQINRGKTSSERLLSSARLSGARTLILIHSNKGNPSLITFISTYDGTGDYGSCEFNITSVKLQREFPKAKFDRSKKLYVLIVEGSKELRRLGAEVSRFLGGHLVQENDMARPIPEQGADESVLVLQEESKDSISLGFASRLNLQEIGPLIKIAKKNALIRLGGAYIE